MAKKKNQKDQKIVVSKEPIEVKKSVSTLHKVVVGGGLGLLCFVVVLVLVGLGAFFFYQNKIYPNVLIAGVNVGGLTKNQAKIKLGQNFTDFKDQKIIVTASDGKSWTKSPADLGFQLDAQTAVDQAYHIGRQTKVKDNVHSLFELFLASNKISLTDNFKTDKIDSFVADIAKDADAETENAGLEITKNGIVETGEKAGQKVDQTKLTRTLISHLNNMDKRQISITLISDEPKVYTEGLSRAKDTTKAYLSRTITLSGAGRTFVLGRNQISQILDFSPSQDKVENGKGVYLAVNINNDKLNSLLQKYTDSIKLKAVNAVLGVEDGQVKVTTNAVEGKEVDIDALDKAITAAIQTGSTNKIDVPIKTTDPQLGDDFSKLGIKDLIGTATTSFGPHIDNRLHNITLGASSINGYLLKPGQEFSTLGALGPIDAAHGYLPELVILNDKVTPAAGGGLCQVSTTLFRAALNSGLPITQRQNHSLRVSYYEPPVGLDATIYSPSPDFKFKNDTANWVLIQSQVVGHTLTFSLFGTKDGRRSEIIGPTLLYTTPPPATEYIDNPDLPDGQTQKVQSADPGGKATATYNVYDKDGKLMNHQVFNSVYDAVPAVYYRGTKK